MNITHADLRRIKATEGPPGLMYPDVLSAGEARRRGGICREVMIFASAFRNGIHALRILVPVFDVIDGSVAEWRMSGLLFVPSKRRIKRSMRSRRTARKKRRGWR